jgi:hypothetical protein
MCTADAVAVGGYDEEYLKGMAFDDDDFGARLYLRVGGFAIDNTVIAWHQMHEDVAYSDDWMGFRVSQEYTRTKWGGLPFREDSPLVMMMRKDTVGTDKLEIRVERKEAVSLVQP